MKQHYSYTANEIGEETLEEVAKTHAFNFYEKEDRKVGKQSFIEGAKWQQEQIGKSEFLQRLRGTLSDAEARRLIFETFKKK